MTNMVLTYIMVIIVSPHTRVLEPCGQRPLTITSVRSFLLCFWLEKTFHHSNVCTRNLWIIGNVLRMSLRPDNSVKHCNDKVTRKRNGSDAELHVLLSHAQSITWNEGTVFLSCCHFRNGNAWWGLKKYPPPPPQISDTNKCHNALILYL